MFSFFSTTKAEYKKIFFDLSIKDINDKKIDLSIFKGKTVLLVNVASNCGFTKQYADLQGLYEKYQNDNFFVIGIPSNQFGGQEPGSNEEIKNFCKVNFNTTFPMMGKSNVKGVDAHPIYLWAKENFGKSAIPKWNFHKILINKEGKIQNTFNSFVKPMSHKIISEIEKIL
jgi:glutathione peroxidase